MRRRKPRLSDLPQEILERVFLASKNLSLPLVNRALRRRLSSNSIKWQLVGAAFGPTWNAWYGLDNTAVVSYDGWISDAERIEGDPTFQASLIYHPMARLLYAVADICHSPPSSPAPGLNFPCSSTLSTSGSDSRPIVASTSPSPS